MLEELETKPAEKGESAFGYPVVISPLKSLARRSSDSEFP